MKSENRHYDQVHKKKQHPASKCGNAKCLICHSAKVLKKPSKKLLQENAKIKMKNIATFFIAIFYTLNSFSQTKSIHVSGEIKSDISYYVHYPKVNDGQGLYISPYLFDSSLKIKINPIEMNWLFLINNRYNFSYNNIEQVSRTNDTLTISDPSIKYLKISDKVYKVEVSIVADSIHTVSAGKKLKSDEDE